MNFQKNGPNFAYLGHINQTINQTNCVSWMYKQCHKLFPMLYVFDMKAALRSTKCEQLSTWLGKNETTMWNPRFLQQWQQGLRSCQMLVGSLLTEQVCLIFLSALLFSSIILIALFPILGLGIGTDHVKFNLWKNSFINTARNEI